MTGPLAHVWERRTILISCHLLSYCVSTSLLLLLPFLSLKLTACFLAGFSFFSVSVSASLIRALSLYISIAFPASRERIGCVCYVYRIDHFGCYYYYYYYCRIVMLPLCSWVVKFFMFLNYYWFRCAFVKKVELNVSRWSLIVCVTHKLVGCLMPIFVLNTI